MLPAMQIIPIGTRRVLPLRVNTVAETAIAIATDLARPMIQLEGGIAKHRAVHSR